MNKNKKTLLKNILFGTILSLLSLSFCLAILENALRMGLLDGLYEKHFVWLHPKYKALNRLQDARNGVIAVRHSMKFTDRDRTPQKPPGVNYRIAVLGDSFIQGDGVSYDQIWSHILEKKLFAHNPSVEVVSWGMGGWSTAKQFAFFKQVGVNFRPDLLIVGFVLNDLEDLLPPADNNGVVRRERKVPFWKTSISEGLLKIKPIFPFCSDFLSAYFEQYYRNQTQQNYTDVLQESEFGEKNLQRYDAVLAQFKAFCDQQNIPLMFVLTPNNYDESFKKILTSIEKLLQKNQIPYVNTYDALARRLNNYTPFQLRANPANGHPGHLVTQVYADVVYDYLLQNNAYLKNKP